MKRNLSLIALFALVTFVSCGYKASNDSTTTTPQNSQVPAGFPTSNTGKVESANPSTQSSEVSKTNTGTGASTTANPAPAPSGSTAGINPAHGQPGHRCDIAVGAPLDSKPTTTTSTTTPTPNTTTPTVTTNNANPIPTVNTPAKTGAGINPAHGQPGHRCDIAVGAPLDSKPTTTQGSTPVSSTPVLNNSPLTATPVVNQAQKSTVNPIPVTPIMPAGGTQTAPATGAGLNPAHGQPGHRCDIAVGAPLNSKPAATPGKQ